LEFIHALLLLFMLLNPFLVILYLFDAIKKLSTSQFNRVMLKAGIISLAVFLFFSMLGDYIFNVIFQAEFASFQIFGGIVFLVIGLQFVFKGSATIDALRGEINQMAGAIAMPILIGPGTISASVLIGKRLKPLPAVLAIVIAVGMSILIMIILKQVHDRVKTKREDLIERYTEVAGRILSIYVGTISIEMIMRGLHVWMSKVIQ